MGLGAAALLAAAPARAHHVGLRIESSSALAENQGALGRLVPGRGPTFSREEALEALEDIPRCPCRNSISLTLPPGGEHEYNGPYWVWITGPGYPPGAMLVSDRTRVPGLISIYDLEPTLEALHNGDEPPVTARRQADVRLHLERLGERLDRTHDARTPASLVLAGFVALFALLALALRSALFGRAALLAAPAALAGTIALSALEVTEPWVLVLAVTALCGAGATALAAITSQRQALAVALLAIFPLYLVVFSLSTETASLAAIGARPENGGRFYGFNNLVETLLLVPALLGAALLGRVFLVPSALLALVTVGASFAGADGGGVLVLAAGFLFLWLRLRRVPLTSRNLALAGAAVVAIGLALVGIDAALGGSSHVTRSLGGGPDQVARDVAERLADSAGDLVFSLSAALVVAVSVPVLVWLALRRPRYTVLDALLVALTVSLLVNDAPREVAGYGALSAAALRFWYESRQRVQ